MTKWIKTALTTVALLGAVCVTPVLAEDAPKAACAKGAFEDFRPALEAGNVTINEVPPGVIKALTDAKGGPPPGIKEGEEFKLLRLSGTAGHQLVAVDKDGCVTWATPVLPRDSINKFLGLTDV